MSKTVLIVGGGVIGLCCAYYAVRAGHRVTLLEQNQPNRDMASLGNAGMIVPSHVTPLATPSNVKFGLRNIMNPESPFYVRPRVDKALIDWGLKFMRAANAGQIAKAELVLRDLGLASRALYLDLASEFDFGLVQKGLLMLCTTRDGLRHEAEYAAHVKSLGMAADVLSADETRALDPGVTFNIEGAVHFPNDCHLPPRLLIDVLTHWLSANGATFRYGRKLHAWRLSNGQVVGAESVETRTPDMRAARVANTNDAQVHEADEYVVAGGVWSDQIAGDLGVSMPLQGGKGYSLTLAKPRQLPQLCSILVEARAAVTPMGDTLRVGGTMEIAGHDESVNPQRVRGIIKSFVRYYSAFAPQDFERVTPWRGLRPVSPDGLPYIGRVRGHANVSVAAGHAMVGLSLAPITGKLIADGLSGAMPAQPLLDPARFT
jgi:D-amino-acid dehydrogenase